MQGFWTALDGMTRHLSGISNLLIKLREVAEVADSGTQPTLFLNCISCRPPSQLATFTSASSVSLLSVHINIFFSYPSRLSYIVVRSSLSWGRFASNRTGDEIFGQKRYFPCGVGWALIEFVYVHFNPRCPFTKCYLLSASTSSTSIIPRAQLPQRRRRRRLDAHEYG